MGNQEAEQIGNGQTYPMIAKKHPTRSDHTTKPGRDIPSRKHWQSEVWRLYGTGCDSEMTEIQHLKGRIPKEDTRTTMSQVRTTRTLSQELPEKGRTQTLQRASPELATR